MKLELKPFTELVDSAVAPTRASLRWIWPAAVPYALGAAGMIIAQTSFYEQFSGADFANAMWAAMSGMFGAIFFMMVWLLLASSALAAAAVDRLVGRDTSFFSALGWVLSPRTLFTLFGMAVMLAIGFLLCFIPGLVLLPFFGLLVPVMRVEGLWGLEAYKRSFALVWFNNSGRMADSGWLFMLGIVFITWLFSSGLASVITLPMAVYQQWIGFDQVFSGEIADPGALMREMQLGNILAQVASAFAQTTAWIYAGYATGLFYFETRRRREAYDLEKAIATLNGAGNAPL